MPIRRQTTVKKPRWIRVWFVITLPAILLPLMTMFRLGTGAERIAFPDSAKHAAPAREHPGSAPGAEHHAAIRQPQQMAFDKVQTVRTVMRSIETLENDPLHRIRFQHHGINQGLSNSVVNVVRQDPLGFIWIGTRDGLDRYDGHNTVSYKADAGRSTGISGNIITDIEIDNQGVLWIATEGSGMNRFDPVSGIFMHFRNAPENPSSLSSDIVFDMVFDEKGILWLATAHGLDRFDPERRRFTRYAVKAADADAGESLMVNRITVQGHETVWLATNRGLASFDTKREQFTLHTIDAAMASRGENTFSVHAARDGRIWFGRDNALGAYDPARRSAVLFSNIPHAVTIHEDPRGEIWAGTWQNGLYRLDPRTLRAWKHEHHRADSGSLSSSNVMSLFQDREGLIWVGVRGGGVNICNPAAQIFNHFFHDPEHANSLGDNEVLALMVDSHGTLWAGTDGGGLNRYENGKWTRYEHDPSNPQSIEDNLVSAICEDPGGRLWIGLRSGINRLDPATGRFERHDSLVSQGAPEQRQSVISCLVDDQGTLWTGTHRDGLTRIMRGSHPVSYRHDNANSGGLGGNRVTALFVDSRNVLWAGTASGISRYDASRDAFTAYSPIPQRTGDKISVEVNSIAEDAHGRLWLGARLGLFRFERETGRFTRFDESMGLASNSVSAVLIDERGKIWISSHKGISRFDPEHDAFLNFDHTDGLQSNEFIAGAAAQSLSGELFFGGINGFNSFYPGHYKAMMNLHPKNDENRNRHFCHANLNLGLNCMSYKPWFVALHGAFIELARLLYFCSNGIFTHKIAWVTVPLKALVQPPWGLAVSSQCALQS